MVSPTEPEVRRACPSDLPQLRRLRLAHAAFERAEPPSPKAIDRLGAALFADAPTVWCWVASRADGWLTGYANASLEFDTRQSRDYLNLDCLYLEPSERDSSLGGQLLRWVTAHARVLGIPTVRWQIPIWNRDPNGFSPHHGTAGGAATRVIISV